MAKPKVFSWGKKEKTKKKTNEADKPQVRLVRETKGHKILAIEKGITKMAAEMEIKYK